MNIIDKLKGKNILIWGYGREGKSTEKFLNKYCDVASVKIFEGDRDGINEENFDFIIKSPGIIMNEENPKYTSQTELFLGQFRDNVIGITGTKGKSTTSAILYTVLKECSDRQVILLGNIGRPCLDYFEEITDDTIVIYEMSCHQLAHTKISPHIAVFLNFYEEHLDYYKTVDNYFAAKKNITNYQTEDDYLFLGIDVPQIETNAKIIKVFKQTNRKFQLSILGEHNQYNAEFVYTIAVKFWELDEKKVLESMNNFRGLPHRLEYIGKIDDIYYYDDSISTIPEATISAINSIINVQTVLIGGMDRKINYDILLEFIRQNKQLHFICFYESGKRIYQSVSDCDNCHYVADLESGVLLAKEITEKGKACILSPASASYGYFKNFEERGDMYKKYVLSDMEIGCEVG